MPIDPASLLLALENMLRRGLAFQFENLTDTTPSDQLQEPPFFHASVLTLNSTFRVDVLLKNVGPFVYRNIRGVVDEGSATKRRTGNELQVHVDELLPGGKVRIGVFEGQVKSDVSLLEPAYDQLVKASITQAFADLSMVPFSDSDQLIYHVGTGPILGARPSVPGQVPISKAAIPRKRRAA